MGLRDSYETALGGGSAAPRGGIRARYEQPTTAPAIDEPAEVGLAPMPSYAPPGAAESGLRGRYASTASPATEATEEEKGTFSKVLDFIDAPGNATRGAIDALVTGGDIAEQALQGLRHERDFAIGKTMEENGVLQESPTTRAVLGFAGDLLADPLNLVGVGALSKTGKIASTISKTARFEKLAGKTGVLAEGFIAPGIRAGSKLGTAVAAIPEKARFLAPTMAQQAVLGQRTLINIAGIPVIKGAFAFDGVGRLAGAIGKLEKAKSVAQWSNRVFGSTFLLPEAAKDALEMSRMTKNEYLSQAFKIKANAEVDRNALDQAAARLNIDVNDRNAALSQLWETKKLDEALAGTLEIDGKLVKIKDGEYAIIKRYIDRNKQLLEEAQSAGIDLSQLSNVEMDYMSHLMTRDAMEFLGKELPGNTFGEKASHFIGSLRAAEPGFAKQRLLDMSADSANKLAWSSGKLPAGIKLFHDDPVYAQAAREISQLQAKGKRDLISKIGQVFGVKDAMPPLPEMATRELARESKDVFYAMGRATDPVEKKALEARLIQVENEQARRLRVPKPDDWEQIPDDSAAQLASQRPSPTGTDLKHLRIDEGAQSGVEHGLTGSDNPRAPSDRRRTLATDEPGYPLTVEGERMRIGAAEARSEEWRAQQAGGSVAARPVAYAPVSPYELHPGAARGSALHGYDYKPFTDGGSSGYIPPRARRQQLPAGHVIVKDGPLKGIALPTEVHDLATAWQQATMPKNMTGFLRDVFDPVQRWWAGWSLAVRPAFHIRNVVGNIWNNYLGGVVNPQSYLRAGTMQMTRDVAKLEKMTITTAGGATYTYRELLDAADRLSVRKSGQYAGGVQGLEESLLRGADAAEQPGIVRRTLAKLPLGPGATPDNNLAMKVGTLTGQFFEENARLAHFIEKVAGGESLESAALSVKKHLFDYNELTDVERNVFKRIAPFYTWSKNNIPLQLEKALKHPARFAVIPKAKGEIEATQKDNVPEGLLPKFMQNALAIRLGRDPNNPHLQSLVTLGSYLPAADLAKVFGKEEITAALAGMISPFIKAPLELASNTDLFRSSNKGERVKINRGHDVDMLGGRINPYAAYFLKAMVAVNEIDRWNPGQIFGEGPSAEHPGGVPAKVNLLAPFGADDATTRQRQDIDGPGADLAGLIQYGSGLKLSTQDLHMNVIMRTGEYKREMARLNTEIRSMTRRADAPSVAQLRLEQKQLQNKHQAFLALARRHGVLQ